MPLGRLIQKSIHALEILSLPQGLRLKLTEPSFETATLRVCQRLKNAGVLPKTVMDVGANKGQFALAAHTFFPGVTVHSYEPVTAAVLPLQALAQRLGGVTVHPFALGQNAGQASITVTSNVESSSFLPLHANHLSAYPKVTATGTQTVEVRTLAGELARLAPAAPVLLKLDVQGLELEVLKGGGDALTGVRWVVLETSSVPFYQGQALFEDLRVFLQAAGFVFRFPLDIHQGEGGISQFDALFERV